MRTIKTYSKGAPFYIASASRHVEFYQIPTFREDLPVQTVDATPYNLLI